MLLLTGISLLFFTKGVVALDLSFDAPSSVELNEEFDVEIDTDSPDEFDVKIFVHSSDEQSIARNQYLSEIYDGEKWEDSWYYLKEAYPDEDTFQVRVIDESGDYTICVRLRSSSDAVTTECEDIEVGKDSDEEDEEEKELNGQIEKEIEFIAQETVPEEKVEKTEEKIVLNNPSTNKVEEKIQTRSLTKRLWIVYTFSFFLLIIIVLLAARKL